MSTIVSSMAEALNITFTIIATASVLLASVENVKMDWTVVSLSASCGLTGKS